MKKIVTVNSEIGKLKTVLLKRPGREVENIIPEFMERLLFDDIPYLPVIQTEHDTFATVLQENGTEVLYLEELVLEALKSNQGILSFVQEMLSLAQLSSTNLREALTEYLLSLSLEETIEKLMSGIRKEELNLGKLQLADYSQSKDYPFLLDPLPNLYFTRDPGAVIGDGVVVNRMTFTARRRESLFIKRVMTAHPAFADVLVYDQINSQSLIEGGDILILNEKVIAVGISQRTSAQGVEALAKKLFAKKEGVEKIIAIKIPNQRAMMHLDTVFTMVDVDKFTIHPDILSQNGEIDCYLLEPTIEDPGVKITCERDLQQLLKRVLGLSELVLVPCGGGDPIAGPREQWNDGSNTLAIAPGVVITYDRNYVTNNLLRSVGVKVLEIPSGELSRGRGGPRCMSMPLHREPVSVT